MPNPEDPPPKPKEDPPKKEKKDPSKKEKDLQEWERFKKGVVAPVGVVTEKDREDIERALREYFPNWTEKKYRQQTRIIMERREYGERGLTTEQEETIRFNHFDESWKAVDELVSDIYKMADMRIDEPFDACFDMEMQIKLTAIRRTAMHSEHGHKLIEKMDAVHTMRRLVHNAMYLVEGGHGKIEDTMKMMQVQSGIADVAFGCEGVAAAHRIYEDHFYKYRMEGLRGQRKDAQGRQIQEDWIPTEDLFYNWKEGASKIDEDARKLFIKALKAGAIDDKEYSDEEVLEEWPEWKINRALHLGRAMGSVTGRFAEIVSEVRLPEGEERNFNSPYDEDFVRTFNPIENLVRKFGVGRTMAYLTYLFGGEMKTFKNIDEIKEAFNKVTDVQRVMRMSKKERDKIPNFIWNLTSIDSRSGGWRLGAAAEGLKDEQLKYIGIEKSLEDTEKHGKVLKGANLQKVLRHNQDVWDRTLRRSPIIVLRGLLPIFPDLQGKINQKAFGSLDNPADLNEIEDWLLVLKEKAVKKMEEDLDFDLVDDKDREKVKKYADAIRDVVWNEGLMGGSKSDFESNPDRQVERVMLVDKNGDMKKIFPHTIAVSDIPFEHLEYIRSGHIGNFGRRWRDILGADNAKNGFMAFMEGLPRAEKSSDYIKMLEPFYEGLREFDRDNAQKTVGYMTKMIGMANKKLPAYQWMPWGVDKIPSVFGLFPKAKSYAQKIFGSDAACWDKIDTFRFVEDVGKLDYINSLGEGNKAEELIKDLKIGGNHRALELIVRWGPPAMVFLLYLMMSKLAKEMEEDLKES